MYTLHSLFLPLDLLPLTPIPLLQRHHTRLTHLGIPRKEDLQFLGRHDGTDFEFLLLWGFGVEGAGFAVCGADEEGLGEVRKGIGGGCGRVCYCDEVLERMEEERRERGGRTAFLSEIDGAVAFLVGGGEEGGELGKELKGLGQSDCSCLVKLQG